MYCANGHLNPGDQRFCGTCGISLVAPIPIPVQAALPYPAVDHRMPTHVQVASIETGNIARFGRRFVARLIDCVLIWLAYVALYLPVAENQAVILFLVTPAWLVSWLLYEWLCIANAGATLGKKLLGIVVVDQNTGSLLAFGPAFLRAVIPVAGVLPLYLGTLLVYLSPLFDKLRRMQGWHDKAASDLVVLRPR